MQGQIEEYSEIKVSKWMKTLSVIVLIGYGWLASVAFEPRFTPSPAVTNGVAWIEHGAIRGWSEIQAHRSLSLAAIAGVLREMEPEVLLLGGFAEESPSIVIDTDSNTHYGVSDTHLEISESIATSPGQLRKALLKSWVLQNGSPAMKSSLLRIEVLSDVLGAMVSADPSFSSIDGHHVEFPRIRNWLWFAGSLNSLCGSPWASLDLQGKCGSSDRLHALSFRPLLTSLIWKTFDTVSAFDRLRVMRAWVSYLQSAKVVATSAATSEATSEAAPFTEPSGLKEWRDWLRSEFDELFPVASISKSLPADVRESLEGGRLKALADSDLLVNAPLELTLSFHSGGNLNHESTPGAIAKNQTYLVIPEKSEPRLFPSGAALTTAQLRDLTSQMHVLESCGETAVGDILDLNIATKHVLFIRSCETGSLRVQGWATLAYGGLGEFSYARADAAFVQLNTDQLRLAVRRGILSREQSLMGLISRNGHKLLGLNEAQWRRDMGAFHAVGAIEAVEWFRPANAEELTHKH